MKDVILAVSKNLLTPHGLRSLSPKSDNYKGVYEGNWFERDSAYHQGTVWAFLIGPYLEAFLKTNNFSYVSKKYVKLFLKKFAFENTRLTGAGFISEIFNGDPPHIPHGACAQAWSCAEVLRVFLKYFL
jgi:glycogen debranching enzyme